jgi:hypothetical protein
MQKRGDVARRRHGLDRRLQNELNTAAFRVPPRSGDQLSLDGW